MEICNVIVKRFADKHYAICTGHLGNHCECVVYNTEWTRKRVHTKSHRDVLLLFNFRYE
jgi:hypothetical protein